MSYSWKCSWRAVNVQSFDAPKNASSCSQPADVLDFCTGAHLQCATPLSSLDVSLTQNVEHVAVLASALAVFDVLCLWCQLVRFEKHLRLISLQFVKQAVASFTTYALQGKSARPRGNAKGIPEIRIIFARRRKIEHVLFFGSSARHDARNISPNASNLIIRYNSSQISQYFLIPSPLRVKNWKLNNNYEENNLVVRVITSRRFSLFISSVIALISLSRWHYVEEMLLSLITLRSCSISQSLPSKKVAWIHIDLVGIWPKSVAQDVSSSRTAVHRAAKTHNQPPSWVAAAREASKGAFDNKKLLLSCAASSWLHEWSGHAYVVNGSRASYRAAYARRRTSNRRSVSEPPKVVQLKSGLTMHTASLATQVVFGEKWSSCSLLTLRL